MAMSTIPLMSSPEMPAKSNQVQSDLLFPLNSNLQQMCGLCASLMNSWTLPASEPWLAHHQSIAGVGLMSSLGPGKELFQEATWDLLLANLQQIAA